nr:hypothetical protein [Tanacetum cinerariifolium]
MRLEKYFLMIDYSLWEVILNEDSSVSTRVVEGIVQPVGHTSVEQKLARRNELKAHERFSTSKPKNFSNDFLLTTLGAMFEKPDTQAQVWKNQSAAGEEVSAAKQKLMLLDSAAEERLMLLSHINAANVILMLSR